MRIMWTSELWRVDVPADSHKKWARMVSLKNHGGSERQGTVDVCSTIHGDVLTRLRQQSVITFLLCLCESKAHQPRARHTLLV